MFRKTILFSLVCLFLLALVPAPAEAAIGVICEDKASYAVVQGSCAFMEGSEYCDWWLYCDARVCDSGNCSVWRTFFKERVSDFGNGVEELPAWSTFKLACEGNPGEIDQGACGDPDHAPETLQNEQDLIDRIQCCNENGHDIGCHLPGANCELPCVGF